MKKIFLSLAILMGCLAASADNAHTIFYKSENSWTNCYAYCWGGSVGDTMKKPLQTCYKLGNDVWVTSAETDYSNILFTTHYNEWGYAQTGDMTSVNDLDGWKGSYDSSTKEKTAEKYDDFSAGFYGNFEGDDMQLAALTYVSATTYRTPTFTYSSAVQFCFRTANGDEVLSTSTPGNLTIHAQTGYLKSSSANASIAALPVGATYHLEVDFATGLTSLVVESEVATADCTVYYDNSATLWSSVYLYCWDEVSATVGDDWAGMAMTLVDEVHQIWSLTIPASAYPELISGMLFNGGDNNTKANELFVAPTDGELYMAYTTKGDVSDLGQYAAYTGPQQLYLIGTRSAALGWSSSGPGTAIEMVKSGSTYTASGVRLVGSPNDGEDSTLGYFSFTTATGSWSNVFTALSYVAGTENVFISDGQTADATSYSGSTNNYGGMAWTVTPGAYDITFDWSTMQVTVSALPEESDVTIYFDNFHAGFNKVYVHYWTTGAGNTDVNFTTWPGAEMTQVDYDRNIWSYTIPGSTPPSDITGFMFVNSSGSSKTNDMRNVVPVDGTIYYTDGHLGDVCDKGAYADYTGPDDLYIIGTLPDGNGWGNSSVGNGVKFEKDGATYTATDVEFVATSNSSENAAYAYFSLMARIDGGWGASRLGPKDGYSTDAYDIAVETARNTNCWMVKPGKYNLVFDWNAYTLTITSLNEAEPDVTIYYDNSNSQWDQVYIHYWNVNNVGYTSWPGDKMTIFDEDNNIWSYTFSGALPPSSVFGLIFNGGSNATKSNDFYGDVIDENIYKCDGVGEDVEDLGGYEPQTEIVYLTEEELANLQITSNKNCLRPYCVTETTVSGKVISISGVNVSGLDFTEPTYTWMKYEDVSDYSPKEWYASDNTTEEYQAYLDGGGTYWVDRLGVTHTDLSKRTGTLDKNHSASHDCCNFNQAYYRCYLTTSESVRTELLSRNPRSVSVPTATSRIAITVGIEDNTTGIADILRDVDVEADGEPVYYNLQGVRIANPSAGIYIRVVGSRATKIALQ